MGTTNKEVNKIITERFEEMCLEGHFPEVDFKKINERGYTSTQYNMMEYSQSRAKLATLIHEQLKAAGFTDGIFATRLRSEKYIGAARSFARRFTHEDVRNCTNRLRTWMD